MWPLAAGSRRRRRADGTDTLVEQWRRAAAGGAASSSAADGRQARRRRQTKAGPLRLHSSSFPAVDIPRVFTMSHRKFERESPVPSLAVLLEGCVRGAREGWRSPGSSKQPPPVITAARLCGRSGEWSLCRGHGSESSRGAANGVRRQQGRMQQHTAVCLCFAPRLLLASDPAPRLPASYWRIRRLAFLPIASLARRSLERGGERAAISSKRRRERRRRLLLQSAPSASSSSSAPSPAACVESSLNTQGSLSRAR